MSDMELPSGVIEDLLLLEKLAADVDPEKAHVAAATRLTQWVAGGETSQAAEKVTAVLTGLAAAPAAQHLVVATMAIRLCGLSRDLRKFKERLMTRGTR